jgi:hypothetical protein
MEPPDIDESAPEVEENVEKPKVVEEEEEENYLGNHCFQSQDSGQILDEDQDLGLDLTMV